MIYPYGNQAADWTAAAVWILAEFCLFHYFQRTMTRRMERTGGLWAARIICWLLLTGLQASQASTPFFYNYSARLILLIFYTITVNQASFLLAGYVTLIFYLIKDICKMALLDVSCQIFGVYVMDNPWLNAGSMALCVVMQFLILRQVGPIIKMDGQMHLKKPELAAMFFPAIPYALIKFLQMDSYVYGAEPRMDVSTSVVCLMLCICDLIILLQTEYLIIAQRQREEAEALRVRSQAQQEWYSQEQERIREINKIYHDIKHHLNYISSLSDNGKVHEYIRTIAGEMEPNEVFQPTGNEVIDSVLAKSGAECARLGIRLIPSVNGKAFGFMEPKDLLVIFGNALDNAREAASQVEPDEKREIVVRGDVRKKFGVIRVENHFSGSVEYDRAGMVKTTKEDADRHGYGIKNIQSAVRRYGGTVSIETDNEMFILTAVIPMPRAEKGGKSRGEDQGNEANAK